MNKTFLITVIISFLVIINSVTYANTSLPSPELLNNAKAGNIDAQVQLGYWYNSQQNYSESLKWYQKAAEAGSLGAKATIASFYAEGVGVSKDFNKAINILRPLARQGQVDAQYELGHLYFNGIGFKKNYTKAKYWLEKAASKNLPEALFGLGEIYYYGDSIKPNQKKGFALIHKAAMLGYAPAQDRLNAFYGTGLAKLSIPQNIILSYQWSTLSKLNGYPEDQKDTLLWEKFSQQIPYCIAAGQLGVGIMYRKGLAGLPRDEHKAYEWYRKALTTDPHAAEVKFNLAKLYMKGAGVKQDLTTAFQLTQEAALKPLGPAQQQLAYLYLAGMGAQKNAVMAYAWLLLAQYNYENPSKEYTNKFHYQCPGGLQTDALQNATQVKRALEKLNGELTNTQKAQAKARYRQLKQAQTKRLAGDMKI